MPSICAEAPASKRPFVLFGVIVAVVAMLGMGAHATYGARVTADEPQYLLSAISLGDDFDLDIADELAAERYRPFHRVDLPRQSVLDENGREFSPHDPLLPLVLAIPVRLGGWIAAKATMALLAGALAALTAWGAVTRFAVRPPVAFAIVGLAAASLPLGVYATQIYPEIPAALAVVAAWLALTGRFERSGRVVLLVATTALVWLSVKYAPLAAVLFVAALVRVRRERLAVLVMSAVAAASALVYVVAHLRIYGGVTPYAAGRFGGSDLTVMGTSPNYAGRSRRLVALLVDRRFGIAAWSPVYIALPAAVVAVWREHTYASRVLIATLAAGWSVATFVALTMHGWWSPGRQIVCVLPLGVIALARFTDGLARRAQMRTMVAAAAIGAASWLIMVAEATMRQRVLVVDFDRTANPWHRLVAPLLPDGQVDALGDRVLLVAWAVALAASVVFAAAAGRRRADLPAVPEHVLG